MSRARLEHACRVVLALLPLQLLTAPCVFALETTAEFGPVAARVRLEPDSPVIGDPMTLLIEVIAEDGVEVLMPEFGEALDRFSIMDFAPREQLDDQGRTLFSQRYTLRAPISGSHTLPSILIEFVDRRPGRDPAPEGQDAYELLTEPMAFEVASLVPDAASADLSPPMGELAPLGSRVTSPWRWLLGLALLAIAVSPFVYRFWLRWRERRSVRSAYEVARSELDALLAARRPRPEQANPFFVELSGIVRRYLERRFAVRSPELTTERFLELVSGSPDLTKAHQDLLRDFLRQSDLVKFAHHIPSPKAIDEAIDAAARFLEETRIELVAATGTPQAMEV